MRIGVMTAAMLAMFSAAPVLAQDTTPGRYTMTPAGEDMLRLDTQTGAVSRCIGEAGSWVCKSVADDRLALENEIDRLSNENQRLRAQLAKSGLEAQPEGKPRPDAPTSWMPDKKRIEEFKSFFERIMRRFQEIAESMQGDSSKEKPLR